jgi:hypothetical protein
MAACWSEERRGRETGHNVAAHVAFLGQLEKAVDGKGLAGVSASGLGGVVQCDRDTGKQESRIRLPEGDAVAQLGDPLAGLGGLLKGLSGK